MVRIPLYVDNITENIELMITTNKIPNSFSPMNKIENGTQAMLGNDCSPTAKELIVFPKSLNFTIVKPIPIPKTIEIENPIKRRHIVIAMLVSNEKFSSAKDCATIAGDGKATLGHIPRVNINCQIPTNTARNSIVLVISLRLILLFFSPSYSLQWNTFVIPILLSSPISSSKYNSPDSCVVNLVFEVMIE